jgi:hypothetical protein
MLSQQCRIGLRVEDEHRRAGGREAVTIERARGDDVDASRPARQETLKGRD